ncbi:MAG: ribosome maturation factor RimP [Trueperaceae bacterium]|nr:ribosome maturation factor RimP [Trueperaceae bacterium]
MDLTQAARDALTPLGYEVLEVSVGPHGRSRRVLVRIDRLDEQVVGVDDVRRASEAFGLELDRLDPIEGAYQLEVESPGAQRPLLTARHFERFRDLLVKLRAGGKQLSGRVRAVEGDVVVFETSEAEPPRRLRLDEIERAHLAEWPDAPR